jgi:diguanylate cyclase (GGDEF)-like protein
MAGSTNDIEQAVRRPRIGVFPSSTPCHLFSVVGAVAAAGIVGAVATGLTEHVPVTRLDLALAVALFAVAQLARVYHRVRGEAVMLAWGEVGIVAALCVVPAIWLPPVVAAGALLGHGLRVIGASPTVRARTTYTVFVITVGGLTAAIATALTAGPTTTVRVTTSDPSALLVLLLAAATYYVTTSGLAATWAARTTDNRLATVWRSAVRGKRVMLAIAAPVGVVIAFVAAQGPVALAALVPVLGLIHLTYVHRRRTLDERRMWSALADGLRGLNQLDEASVANAALRGALDIFGPAETELTWRGPNGQVKRYAMRGNDPVPASGEDAPAGEDSDVQPAPLRGPIGLHARRALSVGGEQMGELHLRFRPALPLTSADELAFSTFADAVASALHDAGTHRRLQDLAARSAFDAVNDPLTGLCTRSTLVARGNAELRRADGDRTVSLVLFDVDGFRAVNETLNYDAGDDLLRLLGRRLADRRRDGELMGRLGGDEFALLMLDDGAGGRSDPVSRARELAAALAEPVEVAGVTIAVEASAGVVTAEAHGTEVAELLRRADVALHTAKSTGSRVVRYDTVAGGPTRDRPALLAELRDALATADQLGVHIQPTVDLRSAVPVSAEALARWHHPRRGLLLPAEFVPAIEYSELASGFTLHVADRALRVAAEWSAHGVELPISVNLCARCVVNPELAELVRVRLDRHGVAPHRLILEMSESVLDRDESLVRQVIGELRDAGIQVCVDDFGTGSASLAFLTRFAVDEVKIDRSFVARMTESAETAAIVKTTVDLADDLGLRVVAAGVERSEQRDALLELGVHIGQGFLFHRPVEAVAATAIILAG